MTIELCKACADGNVPLAHKLLQKGFDPDGLLGNPDTALHWALANYGPQTRILCELLLLHGASPKTVSVPEGYGPLHWCAKFNDPVLAARFIAAGAELTAKDAEGKSPLEIAQIYKAADARAAIEAALNDKFGSPPFLAVALRRSQPGHEGPGAVLLVNAQNEKFELPCLRPERPGSGPLQDPCWIKEGGKVLLGYTWDRKPCLHKNITLEDAGYAACEKLKFSPPGAAKK